MKRIPSIDIARGLVMIIMALDHTRDMFLTDTITANPTDLTKTTPFLFFTRWITHFCAPSFVFLSGTSAWLSMQRRNDPEATRRWLLSRGLFLIILDLTVVNFCVWYDVLFRLFMWQVIAAIGCGFMCLAFLLKLRTTTLGIIGLLIIGLHDLLAYLPMPANPTLGFLGAMLFGAGLIPLGKTMILFAYPVLPWLGILLAGFATGKIFMQPARERRTILRRIGLGTLTLFILLRAANLYGDARHWTVGKSSMFTFLSFINVSKNPPSLLFTLMTIGLLLVFLSFIDDKDNRLTRIAEVYGKVPMFYYLLHWNVIHLSMFGMIFLQGFHTNQLVFGPFLFGRPPGSGVSLPMVYLIWIGAVASLYPLCAWYGRYKARHPEKRWLRYL